MKTLFLRLLPLWLFACLMMNVNPVYSDIICDVERATEGVFENESIYLHDYIELSFASTFPYSSYLTAEFIEAQTRLAQSAAEIGNFFALFYGAPAGTLVTNVFNQYNNYASQLISALKAGTATQTIVNQWLNHSYLMAWTLYQINPFIPYVTLANIFQTQVLLDLQEILAYENQTFAVADSFYDQSRANIKVVADIISVAILQQFNVVH